MALPVIGEPIPSFFVLRPAVLSSLQVAGCVTTIASLLVVSLVGLDDVTCEPLFESTTDAVALLEFGPEEPIIRRANEQFAATFGVDDGDLRNARAADVVDLSGVDAERRERLLERARRGESFETRVVRPTPRGERAFDVRVVPATEREAASVSFVVLTDVTERAARRRELERREARYRSITEDVLDASDVGLVIVDADGDVVWINDRAVGLFDVDREDALGTDERTLLDDVSRQFAHPERFQARVRDGDTERFQCQLRSGSDDDPRWLEHWSRPIETGLYEGGRIDHYADVTPRRERRRELQRERDRFSALFNNTTDAAVRLEIRDGEPVVREVNDVFANAFDCDPSTAADASLSALDSLPTALSETLATLASPPDAPSDRTTVVEVGDDGRRYLVRFVPTPGTTADDVFAVLTDVTKRGQLAAARRERTRLTELLTTTTRMTNATDTAEAYDLLVESVLDTYDYDAISLSIDGELVRQHGWTAPVRPAHLEQVAARGVPEVSRDVEGDADRTWDRVVTAPIGDLGVVQAAKLTTESFEEPSVSTVELVAAHLEETLQKLRKESRLMQERESMEFLHRLLRHHLLNGLNLVQARLELLDRTDDDEDHFQTIERRVSEMIDRVQTIRALGQVLVGDEDRDLDAVDLGPVVAEQVSAARDIYQMVDIRVDGTIPDVAVRGDQLLDEVLDNLLTNAVQHNDAADPEICLSGTRRDGVVRLRIADNGPGIDDDRKERIFERGVTSLDDEDHGLGLYLVREVVDVYGGDIRVEDSDLGGAAFVLELPVVDAD
ncbi:ATP-binding protein [Haloplanus sp. GCM10025708]|uniref:ATP-binding protein n=1 Tax=Haloferacaceae TaxID=1644056 RepID=UPI00361DA316